MPAHSSANLIIEVIDSLRSQILRLGGGKRRGEELLSDVILACLNHPEYDWRHPQIQVRVMQIAKNRLQDSRRRCSVRRKCKSLAIDVPSKTKSEPDTIVDDWLEVIRLQLGSGESEIVRLVALEGWTLNDVATLFGLSRPAMRSRWHRLRTQLQALLRPVYLLG